MPEPCDCPAAKPTAGTWWRPAVRPSSARRARAAGDAKPWTRPSVYVALRVALLLLVLGVLGALAALVVLLRKLVGRVDRSERDDERVTLGAHHVVGDAILEGHGELCAGRVVRDLDRRDARVTRREGTRRLERPSARDLHCKARRLLRAFERIDRAVHLEVQDVAVVHRPVAERR